MVILHLFIILIIYFFLLWESYYFTERFDIPRWLDFEPLCCRKCHMTWVGSFTFIGLSTLNHLYIIGVILSMLTGIALHLDEKKKGL